MRLRILSIALLATGSTAFALEGTIGIHDPSTLLKCEGKFYVYGTGGTPLVSDDGWTWRSGAVPPFTGLAPDVIHIGDRYYMYVARNAGGQPKAQITLLTNRTLDPESPDFKWENGGIVVSTDGVEDCNGIDPGVLLDPKTGKLWLTYGSYFGFIRVVELDPATGQRANPKSAPVDIAINCEAPILTFHEDWYYLLATHGSCCQGANSNYNIRVGRSRQPTGPFLDRDGLDMMKGGGDLFLGSESRVVGPGHFGRFDFGDGIEVFSYHYEADLDRGGFSVLAIRPLLWRDGWPVAGENAKAGNTMILSVRTGTALELSVEGVPLTVGRRPGPPGIPGSGPAPASAAPVLGGTPSAVSAGATVPGGNPGPGSGVPPGPSGRPRPSSGPPIPPQDVAQVSKNWPAGNIATRLANYLDQAQQKWTLSVAPNAGGYPGAPYFKITVAGTDRALAATEEGELTTVPIFTGAPEQLWAIQQLTDGAYRIMPKVVPGSNTPLALSAVGSGFATLSAFDPTSNRQRWTLKGL
ncbi:MAG: family 43 glycosylhydrolase [Opitutus sp.]